MYREHFFGKHTSPYVGLRFLRHCLDAIVKDAQSPELWFKDDADILIGGASQRL